jgi:hypothetical protein
MSSSLILLREYLRLILISEGKVEDLAKQNPNIPVIDLASSDSTPTKKLLPWMIKQVSKGADVEHVRSVASRFAKDGSRLKNKDINSYSEIDELEFALDSLGASKRSEKAEIKSGAVKIYEDDACVVLRIDTKKAAQQYGKGTKWCITMEKEQHYEEYVSENVLFYYILRKELQRNNLDKIAIAVIRDDNNIINQIQIFDQTDEKMTPKKAGVSIKLLNAIKSNAKSQPKTNLNKLQSEKHDEEFIKNWTTLTLYKEKIYALASSEKTKSILNRLLTIETDKRITGIISDIINEKAIIIPGMIMWLDDKNKKHRENGPALIFDDGSRQYWIHGKKQQY